MLTNNYFCLQIFLHMANIRIYLAILVLAFAFRMSAQEYEYGIIINKANGTKEYVRFSESPKISFDNNDEIVFTTASTSLIFSINDVEGYAFGDVPAKDMSSLVDISAEMAIEFLIDGNEIKVNNIPDGATIRVLSIGGIDIYTHTADTSQAIINISQFQSGVYILTVNNTHTFKFNKR